MSLFYLYIFGVLISSHLSVAQKNYLNYKLQDYDICDNKNFKKLFEMFIPPKIILSYNKPISIKQTWNSTTVKNINKNCRFRVKTTSERLGIYAVITKMKFRKDNIKDTCLDYIEFSYGSPRKFCGNYDTNESNNTLFSFINRDEVLVRVFVKDKDIEDPLELELYLTAHGFCDSDGYQCESENINSCIYKDLVDDNIPNCKNCNDEDSCSLNENIKRKSTEPIKVDYSHIVISALTSLIFTMFGVGTIAYTCWKYWNFCHPVQSEATVNDVPTIDLPETQFTGAITMDYLNQNRPPSPKDLPPSYEDLFPDR